jgi:penicillin-binding protein 1A
MPPSVEQAPRPPSRARGLWHAIGPFLAWSGGIILGLALVGALLLGLALALAYPNLPDLAAVTDYRPKIPLRVYTADNVLIGEFGEERRSLVHIKDVPDLLKSAILAAEDDRFYQHGGIDYQGIIRAGMTNLFSSGRRQGASTITQQVARNFYLSSEQTYTRKIYEILLAFKIEANLTKDQILELYVNQIYLGQRAYGFAAAAQIYFGKPLAKLNTAEAAMLAGLPKGPSANNPIVNPQRAKARELYILGRMHSLGYLTDDEYKQALKQEVKVRSQDNEFRIHAEYAAEMARQLVYESYKEEAYTRGLNVYTTIVSGEQEAAYQAVRRGVLDYERRHGYRGPEAFVDLPASVKPGDEAIEDALAEHADTGDLLAAMVLLASPREVVVARPGGEQIRISGDGLRFAAAALSDKAQPSRRIRRGAIVRIVLREKGQWEILQVPEVESAFVAASHKDGAVRALVGGFDFNRNKFNHVTQAWRQPGSAFKPFVYSASLEKGFTPATVINDAPFVLDATYTGGQVWEPKNYDGKYDGPLSMRKALSRSKNMVSIRILQAIGTRYTQDFVTRFGFEADKHPAYLTMALGAGSVTPWQMLGAYSVFANGGFRVNPHVITRVTDANDKVLMQAKPSEAGDESLRVLDARNSFIMDSLLREIVRSGTATRAQTLKRNDLAGKTGTTNDSVDAWFAGYSSSLVGIAWIGYDQPKSLGDRETGGGGALPIWISYMSKALPGTPEAERPVPNGILQINGEFYYQESRPGLGVSSVGLTEGMQVEEPVREKVREQIF